MHYVYLLRSINYPDQTYIGCTENLEERLKAHNSGNSSHTQKYKPWKVIVSLAFDNKQRAIELEKYLKSGAGRAFAQKRFWGFSLILFFSFLFQNVYLTPISCAYQSA